MFDDWPIGLILVDSMLGLAMWLCLGRFFLSIALAETSKFFLMRWLIQATTPIITATEKLRPGFLPEKLFPVYAAWLIFMLRFYLLPLTFGAPVAHFFDFPLEATLIEAVRFSR